MTYHIYGDSNISRYLPAMKERSSDPQYETISFTKVTNLVLLRDALSLPDIAYPVIVVSALTNLLVAKYFENFNEMLAHCKTIFTDLLTWIQEGRDTCPGFAVQVLFDHTELTGARVGSFKFQSFNLSARGRLRHDLFITTHHCVGYVTFSKPPLSKDQHG
jgi:hypothetical protein